MKNIIVVAGLVIAVAFSACTNATDVPLPVFTQGGILSETHPLTDKAKAKLDGVYKVESGNGMFGDRVVLKWAGEYLSVFTGQNVGYFVLQAGSLDSVVFIEGYWRYQTSSQTGLARLVVGSDDGGRYLLGDTTRGTALHIRGNVGVDNGVPDQAVVFTYERPITPSLLAKKFHILAHRAGGRTSDHLPASENSVAIIKMTERFGTTGIEIDARLTKDGVPILYHDNELNLRLTQKGPLVGGVEEYTLAQLKSFVRLIHGEQIPTLEEALDAVVTETKLNFVWLDTKSEEKGLIAKIIPIQSRMLQKAHDLGRDLEICIGIPTESVRDEFLAQPGYQDIPSLCELTPDDVRNVNARVWGPRWTLGTQNEQVAQFHGEGREAFTWTLDDPAFIDQYIHQGSFDGILTNYPMAVAFTYYVQQ